MPIQPGEVAWNEAIIADFRAHGGQISQGPLAGANLVLLTSIGAKSGAARTSPVGYTRDGERYVLVGSNSGGPTNSAWVANVRLHPEVSVEVGAEKFRARATVTEGAERRRLFDAHATAIPAFAKYELMTERELPVVVLDRLPD